MTREEALQHFEENYVKPKLFEKLSDLDNYYKLHKDAIAADFLKSFKEICRKAQEMQQKGLKGKVGYITYSMLRTSILEGQGKHLIEVFDETWFFDRVVCELKYDAGWAFKFLHYFGTDIEEISRKYIGNIFRADIERIKLREADKFNQYVVILARYALREGDSVPELKSLQLENEFEVRVGDYRDLNEVVYKEDVTIKDAGEVRAGLESEGNLDYPYEILRDLDLSYGQYDECDIRYARITGCNFAGSNMEYSILTGTGFYDCMMDETNIYASNLYGAKFIKCSLKGAVFSETLGAYAIEDSAEWETPSLESVSFESSDLTGCDFTEADLRGAVFIGAKLDNVDFSGANLNKAVFSKRDQNILKLSEEQRKGVIWKD